MTGKPGLVRRARQIPSEDRAAKLMSMPETDFHPYLDKLFSGIDKDAIVEITHGVPEFGADLTVIRRDEFRESVASVVVSMGHLRGETGGKIERIANQIKQCMDIPREPRTRVDSTMTTEIWLVICGEISGNARKRLKYQVKQEYKATLTVMNIEWLVGKFTNFYPEVFLGGEELDFIEKRIEELELTSSLSKKTGNLNLSEWYVEPYLSTGGIPIELDEAGTKITITKTKVQFRNLKSIADREGRVIISGDPGVGKTTALSRLELDILREISDAIVGGRQEGKISLPVMISPRDILECDDCESVIEKCIQKGQLMEGFDIGTLVIDGLDEVRQELRHEVLEKASQMCGDMKWNLIIGTRKIEAIKNPPKGLSSFELMPFEISQAIKLFQKIVSEGELLITLKEGLAKILTQLPMTPLSLILLIEIAEEHGEVPASLADLYNRYFEMVLGKFDLRDKGVESLFQYETKLHFLAELAWKTFKDKDELEITGEEFEKFVKDYIGKYGFEEEWIKQFIAEIERAGIIELGDVVSFKHRSFLDYFAALYIFKKQDEFENVEELVSALYFSDLWSDVTFFYVGIKTEITKNILERIASYGGQELGTQISKFTVGRLLQAGWLSTHEIKCIGIESALEYLLPIRDKLAETFSTTTPSPGLIFADFFPMVTTEWTMGSITLVNALMEIRNRLIEEESKESSWKMMAIVGTLWRFLSDEKRDEFLSVILERISKSTALDSEERSILLLVIAAMKEKSKLIKNTVNKRLRRLATRNPEILKRLLPPIKEGFRRKPAK